MKIFSASQIRQWDQYTILHEPISSADLMERAARACMESILGEAKPDSRFWIVCGPGNNGGDGLAIARLLHQAGKKVFCFQAGRGNCTEDNLLNLEILKKSGLDPEDLSVFSLRTATSNDIIIDALLGIGQSRPPDGLFERAIREINGSEAITIAIDLPSGMYADASSEGNTIVKADLTLSFQTMKLAMFMPESEPYLGNIRIIDIGLHPGYLASTEAQFEWTQAGDLKDWVKPRQQFAHKGQFGSALLLAGNRDMMGAAILAARACMRAGVGKLFCRIPASGVLAMQTILPEAIILPDPDKDVLTEVPDLEAYDAIAVGPGIGTHPKTARMLGELIEKAKVPMVIDADALNLIAEQKWQDKLGPNKVLTPHVGEFHRLWETVPLGFSRISAAMEFSTRCEICVIIKGHYSFLSTPGGRGYFNSTGNPGMAKGGSGDVLTGIILALLAQKRSVAEASRLGMFVHGLAGDLAKEQFGEQAMLPTDTIDCIGKAFEAILYK